MSSCGHHLSGMSLGVCCSFSESEERKAYFLMGLPFRCCLSYPAEQETDEA